MGYQTSNIITTFKSGADIQILEDLKIHFQFIDVKKFELPFKGIIGQVNNGNITDDYERNGKTGKYAFDSYEDMEDYLYSLEEKIPPISKKYPHKTFVFIEVDCFGGACMYEGFAVKNGVEIFRQESTYSGHIPLLQMLDAKYDSGYFEPFTKDFFQTFRS